MGRDSELVLGRRGKVRLGVYTQVKPPLACRPCDGEGGRHLWVRGQHQEPEEGVGRGHWSGFSTHRSHSHRHHGVRGSRLRDLQPQAPPGGLVVLQANPAERVETARLPRAQRGGRSQALAEGEEGA